LLTQTLSLIEKLIFLTGERWIWFRYAFEEDKTVATKPEMHELIEQYLVRHDDEIEELEQDRNKGHRKPKGPRQDFLESLRISEQNEYISGMGKIYKSVCLVYVFLIGVFIELPDMTNGKTLKLLREWDGDKNSMPRMTTIRLQKPTEEDLKKAAAAASASTVTKEKKSSADMMEL
jgi:translation machinery-associated protein 16